MLVYTVRVETASLLGLVLGVCVKGGLLLVGLRVGTTRVRRLTTSSSATAERGAVAAKVER